MNLTETHRELLVNAWLLAREGKGQVIQDWAYPEAHDLCEAGWLERRWLPDGELAWFWTQQAETALDVHRLTDVEDRKN
jgi:hypothetical protein